MYSYVASLGQSEEFALLEFSAGVPQGTMLAHLLFLIHCINALAIPACVHNHIEPYANNVIYSHIDLVAS